VGRFKKEGLIVDSINTSPTVAKTPAEANQL
jgi:hypothetical protein